LKTIRFQRGPVGPFAESFIVRRPYSDLRWATETRFESGARLGPGRPRPR